MAERETADPRDLRGGTMEPEEAKGGAPGGIVPREFVDEQPSPPSDEQEMRPDALGGLASEPPTESVPRDAGDDATAPQEGGYEDTPGSWAGEKANPDHGRTGKTN
jgi:hypothetical protein